MHDHHVGRRDTGRADLRIGVRSQYSYLMILV
jgi:hypothetical protein